MEEAARLDDVSDTASRRASFIVDDARTYLAGHSLGLQPKIVASRIHEMLDVWAKQGNQGHFSRDGWRTLEKDCARLMVPLLFSSPKEDFVHTIGVGNGLTVNLHLLLAQLYRPTKTRFKVVVEKHIFSSDLISRHGFDPDIAIFYLENPATTASVLESLEQTDTDAVALLFLAGIQYYTGQLFEVGPIAAKARELAIGLDLAHAIGNVPLALDEWDVDFAVWCTYKYLNGSPGSPGAFYVSSKHLNALPSLLGWWGNLESSRFMMLPGFLALIVVDYQPSRSAERFLISNPSILSLIPVKASLELIQEAGGIQALRARSLRLTSFLRRLLTSSPTLQNKLSILTPEDQNASGAQLSLLIMRSEKNVDEIVAELGKQGVVVDQRHPDVIRVAPAPLYNTFMDCFLFVKALESTLP